MAISWYLGQQSHWLEISTRSRLEKCVKARQRSRTRSHLNTNIYFSYCAEVPINWGYSTPAPALSIRFVLASFFFCLLFLFFARLFLRSILQLWQLANDFRFACGKSAAKRPSPNWIQFRFGFKLEYISNIKTPPPSPSPHTHIYRLAAFELFFPTNFRPFRHLRRCLYRFLAFLHPDPSSEWVGH